MKMTKMVCLILALVTLTLPIISIGTASAAGGFDEFGYNYQARIFVGKADGVDRDLDGTVWGDPTYANDHLVMKWSAAWDDARFNGGEWTADAWCTNQWNGKVAGGSGIMESFKCVWIGATGLPEYTPLPDGGYIIWGEFETIMDKYMGTAGGVDFLAKATPNGLGA